MRSRTALALAVAAVAGVGLAVVPAGIATPHASAAVAQPARSRTYDGGRLGALYDQRTTIEDFSAPAIGNVTGHRDGTTDVVAGYPDGTIHVWSQATGRQEYVLKTGNGAIQSSPALVHLRRGGPLTVLTSNTGGDVVAYQFTSGHAVQVFRKHVAPIGNPSVNGFFGTPTVADLDQNGRYYIIASSWDQHLYVWDTYGHNKAGFPFFAQDTIWSSPTVAMMDGDRYPRIVFGYDCSGVPGEACYARWHSHGGVVTAITHTGRVAPGWPVFIPGQVVWSTPAVASLFGTAAKQVVFGTGLYWNAPAGQQVWAFDSSGHRLPGFPAALSGRSMSSPAIGNVLGQARGAQQIAIGTQNGRTELIDNTGHVHFNACTAPLAACANADSSPIIGDPYNNGQQLVIAVGGNSFHVLDRYGHDIAHAQIKETAIGLTAAPTLVNIRGRATLFFALMANGPGGRHAEVASYTFPTAAGRSAWPAFKNSMARGGSQAVVVPVPAT